MVARPGKIRSAYHRFIPVSCQPLRVTARQLFIKANGKVNRCFYPDFMGSLNLRAQQVYFQVRVRFIGLARMIGPAMMAL